MAYINRRHKCGKKHLHWGQRWAICDTPEHESATRSAKIGVNVIRFRATQYVTECCDSTTFFTENESKLIEINEHLINIQMSEHLISAWCAQLGMFLCKLKRISS